MSTTRSVNGSFSSTLGMNGRKGPIWSRITISVVDGWKPWPQPLIQSGQIRGGCSNSKPYHSREPSLRVRNQCVTKPRPNEWAQALSDDEWCEFLAGTPMRGHTPPPLPPEDYHMAWVGSTGKETFREAIAFCQLLKSTLEATGVELGPESRLLDIGVGWGRIYRVLLGGHPISSELDTVRSCIELCRSALPGGQFGLF